MRLNNRLLKLLQTVNLLVFCISVVMIILMHNLPAEILAVFRVPTFLRDIDPLLGFVWPGSLLIYQVTLLFFLCVALVNGIGLFFYRYHIWRLVSDILSFIGLFVIWTTMIFFIFSLTLSDGLKYRNVQTALVFLGFSIAIFVLDLVTFFVDEQNLIAEYRKIKSRI